RVEGQGLLVPHLVAGDQPVGGVGAWTERGHPVGVLGGLAGAPPPKGGLVGAVGDGAPHGAGRHAVVAGVEVDDRGEVVAVPAGPVHDLARYGRVRVGGTVGEVVQVAEQRAHRGG